MLKLRRTQYITAAVLIIATTGLHAGTETASSGRNLNPYHEQQLQSQIRKCASGVLACSDSEMRCLKQQELCQLLISAERYDEALQVAYNIYKTDKAEPERRAAHHYLMAEIYNRKMQASRTVDEMNKNRQFALSAAQEVVQQKYPSKWQVSEHARALIRNLSDEKYMASVRQRVSSRQGKGDSAKQAIADAQRQYLDVTQGGGRSQGSPPQQSNFARVMPPQKAETENVQVASREIPQDDKSLPSLSGSPTTTRMVSTNRYQTADVALMENGMKHSGMPTSQPGGTGDETNKAIKQPILVNGQAAKSETSTDAIVRHNLELIQAAARERKQNSRSTYATGQLPLTSTR